MRLEQAIFTSVRSERLDGYQLAATSPGIGGDIARELSVWGPAHDSLWRSDHGATSVNFHPLSGDLCCLSRTTLSGAEYSGRGGGRVYTQMLVLPRSALERFDHDPFLVLQAIEAAGRLVIYEQLPESLPTLPLLGRGTSSAVHLQGIIDQAGATTVAEIAAALIEGAPVAVVSNLPADRLFQAALHQLSPSERQEVSFTTGLRPSQRRPFGLSLLLDDTSLIRQSQRLTGGRVVEALAICPAA
jgi:hypothetical protein